MISAYEKKKKAPNSMTSSTVAADAPFLMKKLVIKSKYFLLHRPYALNSNCWQSRVLHIMNGMGKKAAGSGKTGQSRRSCNLALSWLHPACHAVLFCCVNHDNCPSGSIQLKDYSG